MQLPTYCLIVSTILVLACGDDKNTSDTADTATATATTTATTPTSGAATDTGSGSDAMICIDHCIADDDCKVSGADIGFKCIDTRCGVPKCTDDSTCVVRYSGWVTPCAVQMDCPGQVCIDIGDGAGRCASAPSDLFMCSSIPGFMDAMFPAIEGGMMLTVCANTSATCDVGTGGCNNPCHDNSGCTLPFAPVCDTGTGLCGCGSDADCAGVMTPGHTKCHDGFCGCGSDADCVGSPSGSKCNDFGACGCASDAECTGIPGSDTCHEQGGCGCASDASCTKPHFDGSTQQCE